MRPPHTHRQTSVHKPGDRVVTGKYNYVLTHDYSHTGLGLDVRKTTIDPALVLLEADHLRTRNSQLRAEAGRLELLVRSVCSTARMKSALTHARLVTAMVRREIIM